MAEIVNLRQARKRAGREAAAAKAGANRTAFGLPEQLRRAAKAEQATIGAKHAGKLLDGRKVLPVGTNAAPSETIAD